MILDHRGKPIAFASLGFVPTKPGAPKLPAKADAPVILPDAIGFWIPDAEPLEVEE